MDLDKLTASVKAHEGFRNFPYTDTTGNVTIGYGRNLSSVGISDDEANVLLDTDIQAAISTAEQQPWWPNVSANDARARAFVEILFNIGLGALDGFRAALSAAMQSDWDASAAAFLDSRWARQVGARAVVLTDMIRNGADSSP